MQGASVWAVGEHKCTSSSLGASDSVHVARALMARALSLAMKPGSCRVAGSCCGEDTHQWVMSGMPSGRRRSTLAKVRAIAFKRVRLEKKGNDSLH